VPGHHVDGPALFDVVQAVTGRRFRRVVVPAGAMLPFVWVATATQRVLPVHLPAETRAF
jgi:hypothetical protein